MSRTLRLEAHLDTQFPRLSVDQVVDLVGDVGDGERPGPVSAEIRVDGSLSGQLAVGDHIVQVNIDTVSGHIVNILGGDARPQVAHRPQPLRVLPRRPTLFYNRFEESQAASEALGRREPVEVYGSAGAGKSTLLRHLAHLTVALRPESLVHLSARDQTLDDLLQTLFMACYTSSVPYRPDRGNLRHYLIGLDTYFLLDDVDLSNAHLGEVLDHVPSCRVLVASEQSRLTDGTSFELRGLPEDDAVRLLAGVANRALTTAEETAARRICRDVAGSPLQLVKLGRLVREGTLAFSAAAPDVLTQVRDAGDADRRVLGVLTAVPGMLLSARQIQAMCGGDVTVGRLDALVEAGLLRTQNSGAAPARYTVPNDVRDAVTNLMDLEPARRRVREYFAAWTLAHEGVLALAREDVDAGRPALSWLAGQGHWGEVTRLGRVLDAPLAIAGLWGAWDEILSSTLTAAREARDHRTAAWALHQKGTRALCQGELTDARTFLGEALRIRTATNDPASEVTRHNLSLLSAPPVSGSSNAGGKTNLWSRVTRLPIALRVLVPLLIASAVVGGVLLGVGHAERPSPQPSVTPTSPGNPPRVIGTLNVSSPALDFGDQALNTSGPARSVDLRNTGAAETRIRAVTITPDPEDFIVTSRCTDADIPPGGACTAVVSFSPRTSGPRNGTLTFEAADGSAASATLTGRGVSPPPGTLMVSPAQLSFGEQPLSQPSPPQTATLTNPTDTPVTVQDVTMSGTAATAFAVVGGSCDGADVAPGQTCTADVRYTPTAIAAQNATLVFGVAGRDAPTVALSGTGLPVATGLGTSGSVPTGSVTLRLPDPITVPATSARGAVLPTYDVTATSDNGERLPVDCRPPSRSVFPIGTSTVECSASAPTGARGRGTFTVTVTDTPPSIQVPDGTVVPAKMLDGAVVTFPVTASDRIDGPLDVSCSPASGTLFPVGTTTVSCSATNSRGTPVTGTFVVTVKYAVAPEIYPPKVENPYWAPYRAREFVVKYPDPIVKTPAGPATVECSPPSGSTFPVGKPTPVTCTVSDRFGNSASTTFNITVAETPG